MRRANAGRPGHPINDPINRADTDRFWGQVDRSGGGCWEWTASRARGGYGQIRIHGKTRKAHRVSWVIHNGPIPDGLWVLHDCDNPPCVNPAHLHLGTAADNSREAAARGRLWTGGGNNPQRGERHHNHKLTADDVVEIRRRLTLPNPPSKKSLGREFNISLRQVTRIARRENWRHIPTSSINATSPSTRAGLDVSRPGEPDPNPGSACAGGESESGAPRMGPTAKTTTTQRCSAGPSTP